MVALKLDRFGGMIPAWDDHLLPNEQASYSRDAYLYSGALKGWRKPKFLRSLVSEGTKSVYRVPAISGSNDVGNVNIDAADSTWLEFEDRETDVMRSPVVDDQFGRYYFASPSTQPKYNTYERIVGGSPSWLLGVPAPGCPPGVVPTGGSESSTIGNSTSDSSATDTVAGNSIIFFPIIPDGALSLNSVSIMPASTSFTAKFKAVVYSNNSPSAPFELLATSNEVTGIFEGSELDLSFTNPITVQSDTTYWIGVINDSAYSLQLANDTLTRGFKQSNTYSNGAPDTTSGLSSSQPDWQIWANLTGDSIFTARAYVYTWVTAYGEEGPPSDPTLVNGWSNATWTIDLFSCSPGDMGTDRNITLKRLYRTISDTQGLTTYFFVAELPVTQDQYVDTISDDLVALNDQLQSLLWFPPPEDLQALMNLPNGIAVGFRENEIWFSEPYRPHAWPPSYVLTTQHPIVGLGSDGQSLVACTKGYPVVATGVNPGSMTLTHIPMPEPCASRGSIVSVDSGVVYASLNGLIGVTQYGKATNITEKWITRERWRELVPDLESLHAIKLASGYFAFSVDSTDGFTIELSYDDNSFTIHPAVSNHRVGFNKLSAPNDYNVVGVEVDPWTGIGLLIQNGGVYYYDFSDQSPEIMSYLWRSKIYQAPAKKNFQAFRVFFNIPPNIPAQSDERNTDSTQVLADNQYLIVRVYSPAGGNPVTSREVRTSGELLRILSGFKYEEWQFELEGRVDISNMQVATTVKELANV